MRTDDEGRRNQGGRLMSVLSRFPLTGRLAFGKAVGQGAVGQGAFRFELACLHVGGSRQSGYFSDERYHLKSEFRVRSRVMQSKGQEWKGQIRLKCAGMARNGRAIVGPATVGATVPSHGALVEYCFC